MHVLTLVFSFSLDTLLVCLGIGWHVRSRRERLRLAMVFGACDAMAAALGSLWQYRLPDLATFCIYLLCAFLLGQAVRSRSVLIYVLPVLLSLDNLFSGVPSNLAPALGLGSALMALLGLSLSAFAGRMFLVLEAEA